MSVAIRVMVEVGDSTTEDNYVRIDHTETVIPPTDSDDVKATAELVALCSAALDRMLTDVNHRSLEQLHQMIRTIMMSERS